MRGFEKTIPKPTCKSSTKMTGVENDFVTNFRKSPSYLKGGNTNYIVLSCSEEVERGRGLRSVLECVRNILSLYLKLCFESGWYVAELTLIRNYRVFYDNALKTFFLIIVGDLKCL
jgi:hypothetical protein